jgi:hypothetical protein
LLSEGDEKALMTVAAYIDLNPVRAGMVDRVEDYRWCGYASAVAGNRWARESLGRIFRHSPRISWEDWEELAIFRNVEKKTSHPHPEREKFTINYRLFLQSQGKTPERINQGIATLGEVAPVSLRVTAPGESHPFSCYFNGTHESASPRSPDPGFLVPPCFGIRRFSFSLPHARRRTASR